MEHLAREFKMAQWFGLILDMCIENRLWNWAADDLTWKGTCFRFLIALFAMFIVVGVISFFLDG